METVLSFPNGSEQIFNLPQVPPKGSNFSFEGESYMVKDIDYKIVDGQLSAKIHLSSFNSTVFLKSR